MQQQDVLFEAKKQSKKVSREISKIPKKVQDEGVALGQKQVVSEEVREESQNEIKLTKLTQKSDVVLCKVKAVFPFDFFPDEVIIDVNRVNVIKKDFFMSERVHSISVPDISDVFIETSPIFAALKVVDKDFAENIVEVKYLKRDDAEKARRIIQGLVDAHKQGVDLSRVHIKDLDKKLIELGSITPPKNDKSKKEDELTSKPVN